MSAHSLERSPRFCQSLLGEDTPAVKCVYACVSCVCVSMRLPANNLTSHGACLLLNFNENSSGNIFFRFSVSQREITLNVFIQNLNYKQQKMFSCNYFMILLLK